MKMGYYLIKANKQGYWNKNAKDYIARVEKSDKHWYEKHATSMDLGMVIRDIEQYSQEKIIRPATNFEIESFKTQENIYQHELAKTLGAYYDKPGYKGD